MRLGPFRILSSSLIATVKLPVKQQVNCQSRAEGIRAVTENRVPAAAALPRCSVAQALSAARAAGSAVRFAQVIVSADQPVC